jgi:starch synthase
VEIYGNGNIEKSKEAGVIFYPGPGLLDFSWKRGAFGHSNWSLCGITHTTSSQSAMDSITGLLTAPIQPWDCLICTSTAVKNHVTSLLDNQAEYLIDRFEAKKLIFPETPIIPLGVHTSDFNFSINERQSIRRKIGAASTDLVVLYFGRLSFHAKAHPLAMYQALEHASNKTGKNIILVECGWHDNDYIKKAFEEAGEVGCPSVRKVLLDGRKEENRKIAWASADIFCSLSDNIQETFGITPIEAMAAGLPVVVSDWNGYKDSIDDGVEGFRIPTLMPKRGMGGDLALRHALDLDTYDMYCGNCCSLVSVDVSATAEAFIRLIESPGLRKKMGERGRLKAKAKFDWSIIIKQYESLWGELDEIRQSKKLLKRVTNTWPARLDPFTGFSSYPTGTLELNTTISLVASNAKSAFEQFQLYSQLVMVKFATAIIPNNKEIIDVLDKLDSGSKSVSVIIENIPQHRKPIIYRTLVWLAKLNIVCINK